MRLLRRPGTGGMASRLTRGSGAMFRHAPCHQRRTPASGPSDRAMGAGSGLSCVSSSGKKRAPTPGNRGARLTNHPHK